MKSVAAPVPFSHAQGRTASGALAAAGAAARSPLLLRIVGFALLASFSAIRWVSLVEDPPVLRGLAGVAIACAGGVAVALAPKGRDRLSSTLLRLGILALTLVAGLVAMGLRLHLLTPWGWDELGAGVATATDAFGVRQWPYAGPEEWIRLGTLLIAPVGLTAAAGLAFWPTRGGRQWPLAAAAGVLVGLYATAIAQGQPRAPLVAGLVLLGGVVALLFLPTLNRSRLLPALTLVLVAAGIAVPLGAWLPASKPVIDYNAIAASDSASFDWDHTYGPIDWPRTGQLVAQVQSKEPHYWKAITLDEFDGFRWTSSATNLGPPEAQLPVPAPERWKVEATVTVGALDSHLLLAPGPILKTGGVESVGTSDDGTAQTSEDLNAGDSYVVEAYAPDPSARLMETAPARVPHVVRPYTRIKVPVDYDLDAPQAGRPIGALAAPTLRLPPVSAGRNYETDAVKRVLASPYEQTYRLARGLAAGSPTTYDAVLRIQQFLRTNYRYSEDPPLAHYPLASFLFESRQGYCQQFSGAMALMLRMNGIPARVAAGFASGTRKGENTFSLSDRDAHSWVEVWFAGIGWVPFDPTPAAAPAVPGTGDVTPTDQLGVQGAAVQLRRVTRADLLVLKDIGPTRGGGTAAAPRPVSEPQTAGAGAPMRGIGLALLMLISVAAARWTWRRRKQLATAAPEDEVRIAFELWGRPVGGATLRELEGRLRRHSQTAAADYLAGLRRHRYAPREAGAPSSKGRRALRRAVSRGRGLAVRARAWLVIPPRLRRRT